MNNQHSAGKNGSCKYVVRDAIKEVSGNLSEIAARTGLSTATVCRWAKVLHQDGVIHIASWLVPVKGPLIATYAYGVNVDAIKPTSKFYVPKTEGESLDAAERRQQAIDAAEEQQLQASLARKRAAARNHPVRRDPLVAALFGAVREAA